MDQIEWKMDQIEFLNVYSESGKLDSTIAYIVIKYVDGRVERIDDWQEIMNFFEKLSNDFYANDGDKSLNIIEIVDYH